MISRCRSRVADHTIDVRDTELKSSVHGQRYNTRSHESSNHTDTRRPIHPGGLLLQHPVPMQRCAVMGKIVRNVHFDPVSPVRLDRWSRELIIDENTIKLHPVRSTRAVRDSPVVVSCHPRIGSGSGVVGVSSCVAAPWKTIWHRAIVQKVRERLMLWRTKDGHC